MYVVANGITDTTRQRALQLYMVGGRVREIFDAHFLKQDKDRTLKRQKPS